MLNNLLIAIPAFIVALGLLVIIHEFGHYWVARKVGVKVLRFSVGFGKVIWRHQRSPDETEFVLAAIPLGGYVSMLDERNGDVPEDERDQAFNRQKLHHRTAIVAAGPLFNFVFAIMAYWLMFVVGLPGLKPMIAEVDDNSVAQQAGVMVGEEIVAVDGQRTATWGAVGLQVLANGLDQQQIELTLQDEWQRERVVSLPVPELDKEFGKRDALKALGLSPLRPKIEAIIGQVIEGSPAAQSGLQSGDRLLLAEGDPIDDWMTWVSYVRDRPEQTIQLTVLREQRELTLSITPQRVEEQGVVFGRIGAAAQIQRSEMPEELRAVQHFDALPAVLEAVQKTWDMSIMSLQVMGKMITGHVSLENLSGPLTIAQYAGYSAQSGLASFLAFLAIISLSLGVLNLLPIPMLDGGHLLFYAIEFIKGSPLSDEAQAVGMRVGLLLILMLMSVALYNDLLRLIG